MLQKTTKNILWYGDCSCALTLESSVIMGKNYSDNWPFHQEYKRSHNETNVRHICEYGVRTRWDRSMRDENNWLGRLFVEVCLWLVMNKSSLFSAQKSTYFQFLYCVLVRYTSNTQSNAAWEQRLEWFKSTPEYRTLDRIDGEPMEFEWNILPGFNTLQLSHNVQELLLRWNETPENFTGRSIFMSMFNDISCGSKDNEKECESNAQLVSLFAKRFGTGHWSFSRSWFREKVVFYQWR